MKKGKANQCHRETRMMKHNKQKGEKARNIRWVLQENRRHAQTSEAWPSRIVTSELGISTSVVAISIGSAPTNKMVITIMCL